MLEGLEFLPSHHLALKRCKADRQHALHFFVALVESLQIFGFAAPGVRLALWSWTTFVTRRDNWRRVVRQLELGAFPSADSCGAYWPAQGLGSASFHDQLVADAMVGRLKPRLTVFAGEG